MTTAWPEVALGELCAISSGGTPARSGPSNFGGGIPWVKIGDMLQGDVQSTGETISEAGLRGSSAKVLPKGTVLLSIFATIGRTATLGIDAATNQAIAGLTPLDDRLDRAFLRRFLDRAAASLAQKSRGVAQANINLSILRALYVPLPPVEEQRRIAAVLDTADELLAKRRASIALLDSLIESIFLEMFGAQCTTEVPTRPLGELATDMTIGLVRGSKDLGPEHPCEYIRMNAVGFDGELDTRDLSRTFAGSDEQLKYSVQYGDLLFNTRNTRELVGKTALYRSDEPRLFNNNLMRIRFVDDIAPEFAAAAFRSRPVQRQLDQRKSGTTSVWAVYAKNLRTVSFPVPARALQDEFASRVAEVRRQIDRGRDSLVAHNVLFASLQHRAFRGEL